MSTIKEFNFVVVATVDEHSNITFSVNPDRADACVDRVYETTLTEDGDESGVVLRQIEEDEEDFVIALENLLFDGCIDITDSALVLSDKIKEGNNQ
jgi:hypothetical protein